jgi:hypothetical protein
MSTSEFRVGDVVKDEFRVYWVLSDLRLRFFNLSGRSTCSAEPYTYYGSEKFRLHIPKEYT